MAGLCARAELPEHSTIGSDVCTPARSTRLAGNSHPGIRPAGLLLMSARLHAGIVGGGRGAFIGAIHRIAAELDGQALVVAGAMSSDPLTAQLSAQDWFLDRSYDSYGQMALAEASRPDGIDFVIVATPNHLHVPVAKAFIEA